ncbi:3-oxoacyl-[acyl-carrier protein] reductase [Tamaricihabitans halophyticus]|uniref:3-oxoacyl-[acyl-carrier protein] reductase n=1 Tax=Tamaricihabitans halophyticus TaxID=1262583 RepID=A0A4R2QN86_9PSEU|nr:3-oxoacyl-[acyl-carrier protein] reductase [Tamaricihabitans halophyticus]
MAGGLSGRVALVTGAGGGIGAAIAERLAANGARVAVNDIDESGAWHTADQINTAGGRAVVVAGDISDPDTAQSVVAGAAEEFGGLGVLVNNAGTVCRAKLREHAVRDWQRVLAVNLSGPFYLAQAAADYLASSGHGAIVNIASVAVTGFFGQISYDASKGGLQTLTRSLAAELGREGVRANAVAPGFIDTDIARTDDLGAIGEKTVATLPIRRFGEPNEVADAVRWLAGDESRYVTGQTVFVDGGWVRY